MLEKYSTNSVLSKLAIHMNHKWCLKNCTEPCDSYKDCLAVTLKSEKNIKHRFCFQIEFSYLEKLLVCVHCSESEELHLHKRALYMTCLWKMGCFSEQQKIWKFIVFVLSVISLIFKSHIWKIKSLPNLLFLHLHFAQRLDFYALCMEV